MIKSLIIKLLPQVFIKYLTKGHERSVNAKKNIAASFIIKGFSILIGLVLVPLTINYLNPTKYGIWITLSSIIGWFSFFDIGFGNGLRNRFAESMAKGDKELARIYVSTTYAILGIIIAVVMLLFFCVNPLLNWSKILNAPPEMTQELGVLALIVFTFFCVQFILQLITTILTANQQPAKASLFNLLGSLFSLIVIFILTKTTNGSIIYLGITLSLAPVLVLTASSLWFYKREFSAFAPSYKFVKFSYAKGLMSLGLKFFIIQIAAILLYQTNNIIISHLFGPTEVTPYNVAFKYFGILMMVSSIIMTPFWSAFTEAWTKNDVAWIKKTMKKIIGLWKFLFVIGVIMLIISKWIFLFWVGNKVSISFSMSFLVLSWVLINTWNGIYGQFLNGLGKIKLQLYLGLSVAILNVPLALILGYKLGIEGVLLANVMLVAIVSWIYPLQYRKLLNNSAKGIWNK